MIVEEGFWKDLARHLSCAPKPEKSRREQLTEALANVDRQLAILAAGPAYSRSYGSADFATPFEELTHVRAELAQCLADLGPETPAAP
jgi:hypothetical protein